MFNRIELLRILCVAAETTSFREAATRLGASPQTVTRAIKDLEDQFGEPLFHRSTRHVQITAFGERLVSQAREALAGLDQLFHDHGSKREEELAGRIGITAARSIGRRYLLPVLAKIAQEHPRIHFDMRLSDHLTDSVEQQIDLGVRIGFIRDRRYIARAVAQIPLLVVGTPELLQRHGTPPTVEALHQVPTTALIDNNTGRVWPWMFSDGVQIQPANAAFCTDDQENELAAVLAGLGFGQLPSYLTDPHVRAGRLVPVLQDQAPPPWEMFIYRPQQGPVSPRVRLVHDLLVQHLSDPSFVPQA
ncbi:LysR family transcriptional regulator [Metapseudomonas resinovorans]|uniref:Putative LysR family transcriptional regulator n=1 Tax=Metapseudomonas resinovorans NBRC 106553 TaxID=1245471 RepID=S6AWH7_METRE|nr:LysR family transcriptional regulator [Pseudomonas resinovorans]BAN48921.1 putative LysR family transcriptional regulator [Pseudomonas resinovorans NBRC 106553]